MLKIGNAITGSHTSKQKEAAAVQAAAKWLISTNCLSSGESS